MPNQRIGTEIAVTTTGGTQLREQIRNIQELASTSAQFEALRQEAAEKFPQELEKQNRYIREQINQLQRLYQVGHAERMAELRHESHMQTTRSGRRAIESKKVKEQQEFTGYRKEIAEARIANEDWAREHGLKGYGDGNAIDPETEYAMSLMQGLSRGGLGGAAGGLLQRGTSKLMKGIGGMSLAGKIGVGTGVGLLAYGVYKIGSSLKEGWDDYTQMAPALREISTLMQQIPSSAKEFRREIVETGVYTGTMAEEMLKYESSWMRMAGLRSIDYKMQDKISTTMMTGLAYGIDRNTGIEFTGQMARTGYKIGEMDQKPLTAAIQSGMRAGFVESRLPEYIQQVQSVNQAMLQTATTYNPEMLLPFIERVAGLGLPFQGERGAQVITGLNQAMVDRSGIGFEAARRLTEREFGEGQYSMGQVRFMQEGGATNPKLLKEFTKIAMELGGENPWDQALMLQEMTGLKMRQVYNPYSGEQDSLLELFRSEGKREDGAAPGQEDIDKRVKELTDSWAFKQEQTSAAKQYTKIESAATMFEGASGMFQDAVFAFVQALGIASNRDFVQRRLGDFGTIGPVPDATIDRQNKFTPSRTRPQRMME